MSTYEHVPNIYSFGIKATLRLLLLIVPPMREQYTWKGNSVSSNIIIVNSFKKTTLIMPKLNTRKTKLKKNTEHSEL